VPTPKRTYQLHLVTEPRRPPADLVRSVSLALDGGVDWVQLRDKSASAAALLAQAQALLSVTRRRAALALSLAAPVYVPSAGNAAFAPAAATATDTDKDAAAAARAAAAPAATVATSAPAAAHATSAAAADVAATVAADGSVGFLSVNDRLDVALASGADGVHLAGQSLPVEAAVQLAAGRVLVGRSVHALDEAVAVARAGADYVTFGHVFPTSSHPGLPPRGLDQLREIVDAVDIPVLAIGGITVENLDAVLATGCAGVAVISAILSNPDPRDAAARLRRALDTSPRKPRTPWSWRTLEHAADHQPATV
jgi:thiamine-phosphate pyrophosphorylase